jgi:hypothetical protein
MALQDFIKKDRLERLIRDLEKIGHVCVFSPIILRHLANDNLADHRFEGYGYSVIGRATDATYGRNRRKDVFYIG